MLLIGNPSYVYEPEVAKRAVKIMVYDDYYGEADENNLKRARQSLAAIGFGFYA